MARINPNLLDRLQSKLGLSPRQVYRLIEDKVRETHLERPLAAVLLASENKINIAKYASREDLAAIRGASIHHQSLPQPTPGTTVVRRIIRAAEPVVLDLSFVTNVELRKILDRDVAELNIARSQGLEKTAKTCMVLCGSIAEALLLEKLSQNVAAAVAKAFSLPPNLRPRLPNNLEDWDLNEIINVAVNLSPPLLPDDASTGAHQLRRWRNLIHPGRELKEARNRRITPTRERANNAIAFLQFVARELGR